MRWPWRQRPGSTGRRRQVREQPAQSRPGSASTSTLSGVVAYNEYGGYFVPHSSMRRPAAQRIMAGRVWEKQTLRFLTSGWREGDMVHAGTYFGDFLPALSAACPEGSRIWAFEPNPESFRCAQVTASINDCREVELTNAGLGVGESTATMAVRDRKGRGLGGTSRLLDGASEDRRMATVRVVAVDDVVPEDRHVSILQLDVEGHEGPALQGAMGTIDRCRPVLVLETVPEGDPVMEKLSGLGYRTRQTVNHNTVLTVDG